VAGRAGRERSEHRVAWRLEATQPSGRDEALPARSRREAAPHHCAIDKELTSGTLELKQERVFKLAVITQAVSPLCLQTSAHDTVLTQRTDGRAADLT